jgi:hypothetical protein
MAYLTMLLLADYTATNNVDSSVKCNNTSRGEKGRRKNLSLYYKIFLITTNSES